VIGNLFFVEHPKIIKFMNCLQRQQSLTSVKIDQSKAGNPNMPRNKNKNKCVSWDERVKLYCCSIVFLQYIFSIR